MTAVEGEEVGSYRLVRRLGRGGMGEVWLAEHKTIKSQVAIKLVLADSSDVDAASRFVREAKATAKIRHPGIVVVSDFGERPNGGAYLVMELLDGKSLADRIKQGAVPVELAIDMAIQIAEALDAAHGAGVIHRDLKPGNIFLVDDPAARAGVRTKLLDFGVAKATGKTTDEVAMTATGALVGTPLYMAPEQWSSRKGPVDHRADLYALGVVLYEIVAGAPPFKGPTLGDLVDQHANDVPRALRELVPTVPAKLDSLVMQMLAKDRDARPATARSVARSLRGLRGGNEASVDEPSIDETMPSGGRQAPADPIAATAETVATGRVLPSGGQVAPAVAVAATLAPVSETAATPAPTSPSPRKRRVWIAAGVGTAVVIGAGVWFFVVRHSHATLDTVHATDAELASACADKQGAACLALGNRETRAPEKPELARVFAHYLAACDAKVADGCARVADMYTVGAGVRPDDRRARDLAERACDGGSGIGCESAGELQSRGIGGTQDNAKAMASWDRGCRLGAAGACLTQSRRLRYGIGATRDDAHATEVHQRGLKLAEARCEKHDPDACYALALLTFRGDGAGSADQARGATVMQKACDLGSANACADLGELSAIGMGISKDPVRAKELMQRGCDHGASSGCEKIALATAYGLLGAVDAPGAFTLARVVCDTYGDRFCGTLGDFHQLGVGTPQDFKVAGIYFERACKAGDADSCSTAATIFIKEATRDEAKIDELLRDACDLASPNGCYQIGRRAAERGDYASALSRYEVACAVSEQEIGCSELGALYLDGKGVERDEAKGRAIFTSACDVNAQEACHRFALRLRDGRGLAAQPAQALVLFRKACDLGWADACVAAADMLSDAKWGLALDERTAVILREKACKLESTLCPK